MWVAVVYGSERFAEQHIAAQWHGLTVNHEERPALLQKPLVLWLQALESNHGFSP
jgi:hypothetical protein